MKRIFVSTHYRLMENDLPAGELGHVYIIDWETKEFICDPRGVEPDYSLFTPKGKSHGARGVTVHDDEIWVASSDNKISIYDLETYAFKEMLEFSELNFLHQIKSHQGLVHAVSTGRDEVVRIKDKKIVSCEKLEANAEILNPFILNEREWGDDRLHFNSIGWDANGHEYHVYMQGNLIFNYTTKEIVMTGLNGPHDVELLAGNKLLTSSSIARQTLQLDMNTQEQTMLQQLVPHEETHQDVVMHGFTRGITVGEGIIFACSNPTRIDTFELDHTPIETFHIGHDPYEIIYDIALHPEDWSC